MSRARIPQAFEIPFDDALTTFTALDVQAAIAASSLSILAYGQWRSTASTQSLITAVSTQLNLGTEDGQSGHFTINASNELELDVDLDVLFLWFKMTGLSAGGVRGALRLFLKNDTGGGYGSTLIDEQEYSRNATGSKQSSAHERHTFFSPSDGDLYKLDGGITTGTGTTNTTAFGVKVNALGFKL